jgi:hypothetical protein
MVFGVVLKRALGGTKESVEPQPEVALAQES